MIARKLLLTAAAAAMACAVFAPDADAAWRWRRVASGPAFTARSTSSVSTFRYSSGISRGEYERFRRLDAWYDKAYNGFRPSDFR